MNQTDRVNKLVGEFGAAAKAKLNEGGQPEDQLRNPIEQLFAGFSDEIGLPKGALTLVGEKSLAEMRTRPDFAVNVQKALVGFIEVKAPGKGADPRKWKAGTHDREQWEKLKALPNLLYSDGNAFSLWRDGELIGSIVKLDGDVETSGTKLTAPDSLLPLIHDFLTWQPIAPKNPKELARIAARLCRFLRDEVVEQLEQKNAHLTELKEDWRTLLFPDADDAKFADGYAQAVTFGLLMAKSKNLTLADGLDRVAKELGKTNTLIGTALRLLTEQDLSLGPSLDTLTRVLDVVEWSKIAKGDPEAWLYFYENFLEVYDNKLRKLTGSYYTPAEVVQTMVRLCDDPHSNFEAGTGIYREISKSREAANEIKRATPITVVIGNPPYKEKAKGKGSWIENGSANRPAPLSDWQPPAEWGVGAHAKHLRNLYVYFWRWAAWKVFEQGAGGRDLQPPVEEQLSGIVCYITVAGFLNGPGFQKMRADLRKECDEIWVIDCSPEGHQPEVSTRIFQGVQHPVCIVLASRSPANDSAMPAKVRFHSLAKGRREAKFKELETLTLDAKVWNDCPIDWRAPFLPEFSGGWGDFVALDSVIGDCGSGAMPGRTWIIAPDADSLTRRWNALVGEKDAARRAKVFYPHEGGDRTTSKSSKELAGHHAPIQSIEAALIGITSKDDAIAITAKQALTVMPPIRYGFRSFDRQWIIPDNRVINRPNPSLWNANSTAQIYLTALNRTSPRGGPSASLTSNIPDLDHYNGRGGRVFALWKDAAGTEANIAPTVIAALSKAFGVVVDPVDVFAYVAALLASPAYTARFSNDLVRPGLRVPMTADANLFAEAAKLGREVIWLHSFGERFNEGKPGGEPRLPNDRKPTIPHGGAIPNTPDAFPDSIDYDPASQRLKIGTGFIDKVPPAVWAYEVSGKQVLRQWFSYRKKNRERPQIGDKRQPSPLGEIQPDHWLPEYTSELINVLNVLGMLVELEPKQANLLERICDGPLIQGSKIA